jgi:hypothetical protein
MKGASCIEKIRVRKAEGHGILGDAPREPRLLGDGWPAALPELELRARVLCRFHIR